MKRRLGAAMLLAKLISIPVTLVVSVMAVAAPKAFAEDFYYNGEVDFFTGEPSNTEEISSQSALKITDDCYYDEKTRSFRFSVPESSEYIYSNVVDGMMTTNAVILKPDSGVSVMLYKNGKEQETADLSNISGYGDYTVVVATSAEVDYQLFSFSIVSRISGLYQNYRMPEGFEVTSVDFSGEGEPIWDRTIVDLSDDGTYDITYKCQATAVEYGLKFYVDHTPPQITLEGVKDGVAEKAVKVSGIQKGDTVNLTLDGEKSSIPLSGELKMPGKYVLKVIDNAGNTVTEKFVIRMYLNAQGVWFTLIVIGVIAAALIYMYVMRKRLKVR